MNERQRGVWATNTEGKTEMNLSSCLVRTCF